MPIVVPNGYVLDTGGRLWPNPVYPYQEEPFRPTQSLTWTELTAPAGKITVTIDPDKLARAAHPEWPDAMRASEV